MNRRELIQRSVLSMAAFALGVPMFVAGCAAGALPFITMGLNLIATVLPTIPSVIAAISALAGKSVLTAAQVTKLTAVFQGAQALFEQAETDLNQYQANNDPTLITKIQDILGQIKTGLASALADIQISDPATLAKITAIVNALVDLANEVIAILPVVTNGKVVARKPSHAQTARLTPEAFAARFNSAVQAPSGKPEIDATFASVRAVPKHVK